MNRFLPGFQGHDAMREKAERMFRGHIDHAGGPENMPTKHVGRISHFKKGGHVKHHGHSERMEERMERHHAHRQHHSAPRAHGLQKDQTDLHIPKHLKHSAHRNEGGEMKHGGNVHMKHSKELHLRNHPSKKHHYAHGGNVYEHEMVGEHPSHAMHHYNYEDIMRGEHARSVPRRTHHMMAGRDDETQGQNYKRHGGHVKKMAMGGVGKIRHGEATSRGRAIRHKLDLSR